MSLLRSRPRPTERRTTASIPGPLDGFRGNKSGIDVTPDTAMRHSAWWACVNLLADLISTFPVDVYRSAGDITAEISPPALIASPSDRVSPIVWRRQVIVSWLTRGNAYGIVTAITSDGWPRTIELLPPDFISWSMDPYGRRFIPRYLGEVMDLFPHGHFWHSPALTMPGIPFGLSPVAYAAQAIGLGLAAEQFGAEFFGDGAHPSAIVKTDQQIDDAAAAKHKARFVQAVNGREPVVMGSGAEYQAIQIAPNESQFLDAIRANVSTIARFFRVPPEMIGGEAGNSLTYANVEQRALDLLTFTVAPWVSLFEEALSRLIPKPQFVRLNPDAMLRVDAQTRTNIQSLRTRSGITTPNEERELLDLPAKPGADELLWPPFAVKFESTEEGVDEASGISNDPAQGPSIGS